MDYYFGAKAMIGGIAALVVAGLVTAIPDVGWYPPTLFGVLGAMLLFGGGYIVLTRQKGE